MIKLCTVEEIRGAERAAVRAGRSEQELMRLAGQSVAELIHHGNFDEPGSAVFLVGPGNNGGDGLVAAATLAELGWRCRIWAYGRDGVGRAPVSADQASKLLWLGPDDSVADAFTEADVVVDAVFGIGGRAELPTEVVNVFQSAWSARVDEGTPLWALDIPSGVDADSGEVAEGAFRADRTVMIGLPKVGLYRPPAIHYTGTLQLVDIGLPQPPIEAGAPTLPTGVDVRRWLPRRKADTHKREVGTVLVVGGAPNYFGAPRMAAEGALKVGAGLVSLAVPRSIIPPIASAVPEVTFVPLPEGELGGAGARMASMVREVMDSYTALIVGPGLGRDQIADEFLRGLFGVGGAGATIGFGAAEAAEAGRPFTARAVIDADALFWLAGRPEWPDRLADAELVLTPHPGELGRLLDADPREIAADPWTFATRAARRFRQVVVLKVGHTVVATPDGDLIVGPQALPSLATAGTGDVLAGVIGGLLAQGLPPSEAAIAGVFIGTEAALLAEASVGTLGLTARDLIAALPQAARDVYDARW